MQIRIQEAGRDLSLQSSRWAPSSSNDPGPINKHEQRVVVQTPASPGPAPRCSPDSGVSASPYPAPVLRRLSSGLCWDDQGLE